MRGTCVVLHVRPEPKSGQWEVCWEGHPLASFATKDDAVEDGRGRAEGPQPAQLIVHTEDGNVENTLIYL